MDFSVNCVNKIRLDWQPNKIEQSDKEKSHRKNINKSANFISEVMKISPDNTRKQVCISKLRNIRVNNVNNVVIGTLSSNSLTSKFDEFKLVVSGIFVIPIITETKLGNTFPSSQFCIDNFSMP